MLDAMRKHAQGWVAGLIVGVLALAFALWGIQYYIGSRAGGEVVAKVNGEEITSHQVHRIYSLQRQRLMAQLGNNFSFDQNFQKMLKRRALQQLLDMRLVQTTAHDAGFRVSNDQVVAQVRHDPNLQVDGHFSPERFAQLLRVLGYSQEEYFEQFRIEMLLNQIHAGIQGTAIALPSEIKRAITLNEQERTFSTLEIPLKTFSDAVKITDKDVSTYYQENLKRFQAPAKVRVNYIELKADDLKKRFKPTTTELKQYYQDNTKLFSTPRQWQVSRWHIEYPAAIEHEQILAAQAQLQQVAKGQESHGLNKVEKKTELVQATQDTQELVERLVKLKAGQFTEVYPTEKGVEVVKLLQDQPAALKPYDEVATKVREQYIRHEVEKEFAAMGDKLSEAVYTNPDSLQAAADELGVKVQTTDFFSRDGGSGISANSEVVKEAFSSEVYEEGNNSNVIEIGPGHVMVLRVKEKVPPKPKPLAQVRTEIEQHLRKSRGAEQVQALGQQWLKALQSGQSIESELAKRQLSWETHKEATRQEAGVKADILRLAFSMPDPASSKKTVINGQALPSGDFVIVQLQKIVEPKKVDTASQSHKVFRQAIARGFGTLEFDLYMKGLKSDADVTVMPNLGY